MLKYHKFLTAISDLKKRSHGYVNTKPKFIPKKNGHGRH